MKKLILILSLLVILCGMTLVISACGGGDAGSGEEAAQTEQEAAPAEEEAAPAEEVIDGTKTLAYFNEYVGGGAYTMEMAMEVEGMTTKTLSAVDGDMIYTESESDGMTSISIMKDGAQYILDPASKTCMKMSMSVNETTEMFAEEAANYETALNTGTQEINGKTYDYEEFEVEGVSAKYCFDGNDLKYIITSMDGNEYTAEIVSMKKGADKSLFEIPSDYTMMEL